VTADPTHGDDLRREGLLPPVTRPAENQQTVEALAETVRKGLRQVSMMPADCTGHCGTGPCDCSGEWRRPQSTVDAEAALRDLVAQAELAHEARPYMEKANSNAGPINDWLARLDGAR
jgi:hypothetical protein